MTTAANDFMSKIHDRMPVILGPKQWDEWVDQEVHQQAQIAKILQPCPPEWLDSFEVSTLVNSPGNNRAEVLEPLKASGWNCRLNRDPTAVDRYRFPRHIGAVMSFLTQLSVSKTISTVYQACDLLRHLLTTLRQIRE
jgi:hypothetical protein